MLRIWSVAVFGLVALFSLTTVSSASAGAPGVSFSINHSRVAVGGHTKASYSVTQKAGNQRIYLQRTFGTKQVFRTVEKLSSTSGTVRINAPAVLGSYRYRVAVVGRGKVKAAAYEKLFAYDLVSLGRLMREGSDTEQIGSNLFAYVWGTDYWTSDPRQVFKLNSTSCRLLAISAGYKTFDNGAPPAVGTVTVVQENADPASLAIPTGTVQGYGVKLTGRAFELQAQRDLGLDWESGLYINGFASCYTGDGGR